MIKKIRKIICILILFVILFPHSMIFAVTQKEAAEAIAEYAYNFCMKLRNRFRK